MDVGIQPGVRGRDCLARIHITGCYPDMPEKPEARVPPDLLREYTFYHPDTGNPIVVYARNFDEALQKAEHDSGVPRQRLLQNPPPPKSPKPMPKPPRSPGMG